MEMDYLRSYPLRIQESALDLKLHESCSVRHAAHALLSMVHLIQLPDSGHVACLARILTLTLVLIHLILTELPKLEGKLPTCLFSALTASHAATHFLLVVVWSVEIALLDFIPTLGFKILIPMFNMASCLVIFLANFDFFPLVLSLAHC
ncbi:hypothetical protein L0F63_005344 [Massospora cicadina]|nr:hypothetical protein L0F63_005344 [Massospora cicadina]